MYGVRGSLYGEDHSAPGFVDGADFVIDQADRDGALADHVAIEAVLLRFGPEDPEARLRGQAAHARESGLKLGGAVDEPERELAAGMVVFFEGRAFGEVANRSDVIRRRIDNGNSRILRDAEFLGGTAAGPALHR